MTKPRSSTEVVVADCRSFESAVKRFAKLTAPIIRDCKRRRYFMPKPTRNARRRRGKELEKRRLVQLAQEKTREDSDMR
jgi:ribosomal protein S21